MKTHEFARHLEFLAKLLRSLPNAELDDSFTAEPQTELPGFEAVAKDSARLKKKLPPGLEKKLVEKSPAEIEAFLGSETEAFTVANLVELAERIGIQTSKRQGKNALINLITRHFEAGQMHSIIRGAGKDET